MSSNESHLSEPKITRDYPCLTGKPDMAQGSDIMVLDIDDAKGNGQMDLKLAPNGQTVLIPQPSDDPNDPLNLPWLKKSSILFTISVAAFLAEFQCTSGNPCILLQGVEWGISPNEVNYANNLNVLLVGIGGVFWIPFISVYGRAPVLFYATLAGTLFTLGCILAPSFSVFYGVRTIQAFFFTALQTIGLGFIQDMFFFHEHAKKIGIWTSCFIISPYFGPLLANFVLWGTNSWRAAYWMVFALGCLVMVLIVLFIDEPWYRRDIATENQPSKGRRIFRVLGVWQLRHHAGYFLTLGTACRRLTSVFVKPIIMPIMIYYCFTFMWAVGINQSSSILFATPIDKGGYGFTDRSLGFIYFTPVVAVIIGEGFGHVFNDYLFVRYIRTHRGIFQPEARLPANYIAAIFMIPGIILVGQALTNHLHYAAIIMGWGMFVFGCMVASVAITAYALDSYPTGSGEVSGLINLSRIIGGFSVPYFQQPWGLAAGYDVSFGVQAALIAVALAILIGIHIYGARMRAWGGTLDN